MNGENMNNQEQLQQELAQFQHIKEQHQMLASHVGQMEFQTKEIDHTIEELEGVPDDTTIYKSAAGVLIKVKDRTALLKELGEKKETLDVRLKSMRNQEEQLKKRLQDMETDLSRKLQMLQAQQGMPSHGGMSG